MDAKIGWALFADEAPEIGSGWRLVTYLKGRKWVRVKSATAPSAHNFTRLRLSTWATIERATADAGAPWQTDGLSAYKGINQ